MTVCYYYLRSKDGYGADWDTECGHSIRMESPEDVGMCFPPDPNEDGKYCHYCGHKIELVRSEK